MSIFEKLTGASSGSDLLSQVADGFFGSDYQKDYSHASKLMRPNNMALAPKQKFLFHVYFNLANPAQGVPGDPGLIGALVKSVQLPSFQLGTETYVQYNRKRLVHNKIEYQPVRITFHDDNEDHIRTMWNNYYRYYFADSYYKYDTGITPLDTPLSSGNYNDRDIYNRDRIKQQHGWGKTIVNSGANGRKPAFFKDITIYGLSRGHYYSYTLINPVIQAWRHDEYSYEQGTGTMTHEAEIMYESVIYGGGKVKGAKKGETNVKGFGKESRYDTEPGALGPGSTASTFGQGGLGDVADQFASGNILGGIQAAGRAARTFGSVDNLVNTVTGDVIGAGQGEFLSGLGAPSRLLNFPNQAGNGNRNQTASPRSE